MANDLDQPIVAEKPSMQRPLENTAAEPVGTPPEEFADFVSKETQCWTLQACNWGSAQ